MFRFLIFFSVVAALAHGAPSTFDPSRVVGGVDATEGQYPYQVSLKLNGGTFHNCGGSILSPRTILTAGHCVAGRRPSDYTVFAGSVTLNGNGTKYDVEKLILHERYDDIVEMNDIGLIITKQAIKLDKFVQTIVPQSKYIDAGVNVTLTGWGALGSPGASPNVLQTIDLKTISNDDCKRLAGGAPSDICTFTKKGEGACFGDSGGPLVADGKQVGIVSRGYPCAIGIPDIFTRVSSFAEWIAKNQVN